MEIGRLSALLQTDSSSPQAGKMAVGVPEGPGFSEMLTKALGQVEVEQAAATEAAVKLVTGEVTDLAEVMILSERANLSLGITLEVRNKLLEAYQEIMRMPL